MKTQRGWTATDRRRTGVVWLLLSAFAFVTPATAGFSNDEPPTEDAARDPGDIFFIGGGVVEVNDACGPGPPFASACFGVPIPNPLVGPP